MLKNARIDKNCFDVFDDHKQLDLLIDFVCGKMEFIEGISLVKEERKYGIKYSKKDGTVTLDRDILIEIPRVDIRPAEDASLVGLLRRENRKLKSGSTKVAGLSPYYSIFR